VHAFNTPVPLFLAIVLGYLAFSLFLMGGSKVYFTPLTLQPDDPEGIPTTASEPETIATGAEPWKVGEKGGTAASAKPATPAAPSTTEEPKA
jgi:hypothetical protein